MFSSFGFALISASVENYSHFVCGKLCSVVALVSIRGSRLNYKFWFVIAIHSEIQLDHSVNFAEAEAKSQTMSVN